MTAAVLHGVRSPADREADVARHARLVAMRLACRKPRVWTGSVGVSKRVRRLSTTAAIALVLAVAGSTAARSGPDPVDAHLVTSQQGPPAWVTTVDPTTGLRGAGPQLPPAIHIASSGPAVARAVQVDIAGVLLAAYRSAVTGSPSACRLPVSLLAAIGEVESGSLVGRP